MSASNADPDAAARDDSFDSSRGPVLDRLSTAVAVVGFLLLATNDAPALSDAGTVTVFAACFGVGTLVALVLFRLVGSQVRGPLWLGVITAVVLAVPILLVLWLAGRYTAQLGWMVSVGCAVFGLGATVRSLQVRLAGAD